MEDKQGDYFMDRIKHFKAKAKNIKVKNTTLLHKNIWMKQQKDYHQKQVKLEILLDYDIKNIQDHYNIFKADELSNFQEEYNQFGNNVWIQTNNFITIQNEMKLQKDKEVIQKFKPIYNEIKQFMNQIKKKIDEDYEQQLIKIQEQNIGDGTFISSLNKNLDLERFTKNDFDQRQYEFNELLKISGQEKVLVDEYYKQLNIMKQLQQLEEIQLQEHYKKIEVRPKQLEDHFVNSYQHFQHIYDIYINKGRDRELYTEKLQLYFKGISKQVLNSYDQYFTNLFFYNQKKKAIENSARNQKQSLDMNTEALIFNSIELRIKEQQKHLDQIEIQQTLIRIAKEMNERKRQYLQNKNEYEQEQKEIQMKQLLDQQQKIKEEQEYNKIQKVKSNEYKNFKSAMQRQRDQEKQIKKLQEEMKKKESIIKNKDKVNIRQIKEMEKINEKVIERQREEKEIEEKEERIEEIIKGYKHRPKVEMDFYRVLQQTESGKSKMENKMDKADKLTLNNNKGYDVDTLMRDMRYKLGTYLMEAGLNQNQYAHSILNAINQKPVNNLY